MNTKYTKHGPFPQLTEIQGPRKATIRFGVLQTLRTSKKGKKTPKYDLEFESERKGIKVLTLYL